MISPAGGRNRRTLVIDDNRAIHADFRKILGRTLSTEALEAAETEVFGAPAPVARTAVGFEVDSAYQGQDGVLLATKALEAGRPYALAFVDVRMPPGWDGVETTRRLWEVDPDLQVVLCTAYSDYSWDEISAELGSSDGLLILKKPFDAVEALQLAHALTEKSWLRQESRRQIEELKHEVVEREKTEHALREALSKYRSIFDNSSDGIFQATPEGCFLSVNPALARILGFDTPEELIRHSADIGHQGYAAPSRREAYKRLLDEGVVIEGFENEVRRRDGTRLWVSESVRLVKPADGGTSYYEGRVRDISARKQAEADREKANHERIEASRKAGMAEIATNVLHNVGNVLNSVNVSASLVADGITNSRAERMGQIVALLRENAADLGHYITRDPRGQHIPAFLEDVSREWLAQQQVLLKELGLLRSNIDHIKEIVAMQQSYGSVVGVVESANVTDLVEDSLRMNDGSVMGAWGKVIRAFEVVPAISVDKHKVLQVLINLVRNAKQACDDSGRADKCLTLGVRNGNGRITISVADNGIGIAPDNLTRIFSHGFTTRKDGHGFGLHSSAIAATELGGSLTARSDGPGKGANFTLELPLRPPGTVP